MIKNIDQIERVLRDFKPSKIYVQIGSKSTKVNLEDCYKSYNGYRLERFWYVLDNDTLTLRLERDGLDEKRLKELIKIAEASIIRFEPVVFDRPEDYYDLHKALKLLENFLEDSK